MSEPPTKRELLDSAVLWAKQQSGDPKVQMAKLQWLASSGLVTPKQVGILHKAMAKIEKSA